MQNEASKLATDKSTLSRVLSELSEQNSNLASTISVLEDCGHRAKDTQSPDKQSVGESPKSDGLFSDIFRQIGHYKEHNSRLQAFAEKLSTLL